MIWRKQRTPPKVHAVSFPKSGRTWVQLMIAKIVAERSGRDINDVLNDVDPPPADRSGGHALPHVYFSHGYKNGWISQGRLFPSSYYGNQRVFLLVRDPRDTVVSYYYHARWRLGIFDGTLSQFLRFPYRLADPKGHEARFGIEPILNYLGAFARHAELFSALHIAFYEDFRENTARELAGLCDFLGLDADGPLLQQALHYGSFDNMRRLEQQDALRWHGLERADDQRGSKVRKGRVGGYRQELSDEDVTFVDRIIAEQLHPRFAGRFLGRR